MQTERNGVHEKNGDTKVSPKNRFAAKAIADREPIATCDTPTHRATILRIVRLEGDDRQSFVVYSNALRGFLSHWTGTKTVICWEDHSLCEGGHKAETQRENFLLHAWSVKEGKQVFVYLTPTAAEELLMQVGDGQTLRGLRITVWRTAKSKGRLHVNIEGGYTGDARKIPPELDPYDSIMRFLKVPDVDRVNRRSLGSFPEPESGPAGPGVP
jgi:hypothetical protein